MSTLGELLRTHRMEKNISLDTLKDALKVNRKILESLEQDHVDPTFPAVYVRGFILSYCRFIGIDEHEALSLYEQERATAADGKQEKEKPKSLHQHKSRWLLPIALILLAGCGLAAYIALIYLPEEADDPSLPPLSPAEPAPEPLPAAEPSAVEPSAVEPLAVEPLATEPSVAAEPAFPPAAPPPPVIEEQQPLPAPVRLKITCRSRAWMEVSINGGEPFELTLFPGDSVGWEFTEKIEVKLGNAGGVIIAVDGTDLKPFGKPDQVVRLTFARNTVSLDREEPQPLALWRAEQ